MSDVQTMSFSRALAHLKHGLRVSRLGWNGKGMWIEMQKPDENSANTRPYLCIKTAQGDRVPWVASHADLIEEDWFSVPRDMGIPQTIEFNVVPSISDLADHFVVDKENVNLVEEMIVLGAKQLGIAHVKFHRNV